MWPHWSKSPLHANSSPSSSSPATPSTPSFKDIHTILNNNNNNIAIHGRSSIFHRVRIATSTLRSFRTIHPPPIKHVVVYYTSLRIVRKTFDDCRTVRSILHSFKIAVDERDLTMDSGFLTELKGLLGRRQLTLPLVFIGGRYIGGADEIRQLHESGELKRCVEGAAAASAAACGVCGGARFLLCEVCNGSHKRYSEKGGFRVCGSCNENGLVRCPDCCSYVV